MSRPLNHAARRHLVRLVQLRRLKTMRAALSLCRELVREYERAENPDRTTLTAVQWARAAIPEMERCCSALALEILHG